MFFPLLSLSLKKDHKSKLYKAMVIPSLVLLALLRVQYAHCARALVLNSDCLFVFVRNRKKKERKKNKAPLVRLLRYRHGFLFVRSFPSIGCLVCVCVCVCLFCWRCRYRLFRRRNACDCVRTTVAVVVVVAAAVTTTTTCRQALDLWHRQ